MLRSALIFFSCTLWLVAQQPAPPQQPGLPPGIVPPKPDKVDVPVAPVRPGGGAVVAPRRAIPDPNTPTKLEAANLTGQDVADLYFQYTGKRVLVSSEAFQAEIAIVVPGTLTYGEAARIIEQKLVMEGFSLQPSGENLMRLVMAASPTTGAKSGFAPVLIDLDDEGPADQFVTYVMALNYLKPEEAMRAFQAVVQQFGPGGTVAAVPNAGSVIISGNRPLVRMLVELKDLIDVPSAQVGTKFVDVVYANVEELAERLNEIFNSQQKTQQSARVQRTGAPGVPPIPGAAGGGGSAGEDTPINILAQPRTSRIFLMGRPVDIIFVEGLIADFDAPSSKRNFLRRKLRYLQVAEFIPVAADAIERTLSPGAATSGGGAGSRRPGATGRSTSATASNRNQSRTNNRNTGTGSGSGSGTRAGIMEQNLDTAPESILIGKTLLVGDKISNSIVVNGPAHHVELVDDLIRELDQASEQIAITAVFGKYDISDGQNFGVDLGQLFNQWGDSNFSGAFQNRNGVPSIVDPTTLTNFTSLLGAPGAAAAGFSLYGMIGDEFSVFVNALETNENFTALARPTVFTTNNGVARLSSGSRIAVPTSTFQGGVSSGFSTNVEFRDIVLELEVRPLVNGPDEVTLEISLVRDAIGENRVIQGFGNVPDIDTDEVSTTVTVPNRSTIILGGLIQESDTESVSGVPILSSIPLVGRLFSSTKTAVKRDELVILIHPTIIANNGQLHGYQRAYDAKNNISGKGRNSVEGGLLPPPGAVPESGKAPSNTPSPAARAVPVYEEPARPSWRDLDRGGRSAGIATSPMQRALQKQR